MSKLSEKADNIIVKRTIEHLTSLKLCDPSEAARIKSELIAMGFSEEAAVLIINTLPKDAAEARALLAPFEPRKTLEEFAKAVEAISACRG